MKTIKKFTQKGFQFIANGKDEDLNVVFGLEDVLVGTKDGSIIERPFIKDVLLKLKSYSETFPNLKLVLWTSQEIEYVKKAHKALDIPFDFFDLIIAKESELEIDPDSIEGQHMKLYTVDKPISIFKGKSILIDNNVAYKLSIPTKNPFNLKSLGVKTNKELDVIVIPSFNPWLHDKTPFKILSEMRPSLSKLSELINFNVAV